MIWPRGLPCERRRGCPASISTFEKGARFLFDADGLAFAGLDTVQREAAAAAAEIGRDRPPSSGDRSVPIELRNEHRQRVLTVTVSMVVEWVEPEPSSPD